MNILNKIENTEYFGKTLRTPLRSSHCSVWVHRFTDFTVEVLNNGCETCPVIYKGNIVCRIDRDIFLNTIESKIQNEFIQKMGGN